MMRTSIPSTSTSRGISIGTLVLVGLALLGYTAGLPEFVEFSGVSLHLVVALALATLGWIRGSFGPSVTRYLRWAGLLAIWICICGIAAWRADTMRQSLIAAVWLAFIAPGVANLLRDKAHRQALLVGMVGAAIHYSVTALGRKLTGRELFDLPDPSRALILGEKRGFVNARLLYVTSFLVANVFPAFRRVRWVIVGLAITTAVLTGDRASLLIVPVVGLTYVLLQPNAGRRIQMLVALALVGLAFMMTIDRFGGQAVVGKNRLVEFVRGKRTRSDDIRELQLKRAWHVGLEHPAFGVGFNNLAGLDHPALDDAKDTVMRVRAQIFGVHNTYAQIFGEFGIPGTAAFLLMLGSIFAGGIRNRGHPEVRAATAGFAGLVMTMMVNPTSLPFLYFVLAYIAGLLDDDAIRKRESAPAPDRAAESTA